MTDTPGLGPVALCTLITRDGQALVDGYTRYLHQCEAGAGVLDADTATAIGFAALAGRPRWLLANAAGRCWLQVVEHADALPRDSLGSYGWLALEVLVEDVDTLAERLAGSVFELLRPAADLELSDRIRACQVRGPAGEILYLTQIRGEVPPFELPTCEAPVDHLFIPVLSTPSREQSLAQYSAIAGNPGISFETKITVINQARGFGLDRRHPVATLQLAGRCLLEIDQVEGTIELPAGIYSGMASVALHCAGETGADWFEATAGPFAGRRVSPRSGRAGERFTLVYPD